MQKIATRAFIAASILFGALGISFVITSPARNTQSSDLNTMLLKLLIATGFIVLSSFALSVAGKYLKNK